MGAIKSDPPKLKQPVRRNRSQKRLIQAALSIAADQGVQAVTMEAIGKRAGYSRGLASQRFGSKAGLIRAVISHLHDERAAEFEARQLDECEGLDALLLFVDMHLSGLMASPEASAYFMFLASGIADRSAIRAMFAEAHEMSKLQLMEIVERGQRDGSIKAGIDTEAAALMVGSLVIGISMQFLTDPELNLERVLAETKSVLAASFKSA